jgi:hypothetical protein
MLEALHYLTSNYTYYRAIIIKTAWYWHKNRQEDQWIRRPIGLNPCIYNQLIFDKGT